MKEALLAAFIPSFLRRITPGPARRPDKCHDKSVQSELIDEHKASSRTISEYSYVVLSAPSILNGLGFSSL